MKKTKILSLTAILSLATVIPNAYAIKDGEKFKDWTAQCKKIEKKEICTISQPSLSKDKKLQTVVVIGKINKANKLGARVITPLLVDLRSGLKLAVDGKDVAHIPYDYCDNFGCNASVLLNDNISGKLKKGSKLKVSFIDMTKGKVSYPISLSGITKAMEAL